MRVVITLLLHGGSARVRMEGSGGLAFVQWQYISLKLAARSRLCSCYCACFDSTLVATSLDCASIVHLLRGADAIREYGLVIHEFDVGRIFQAVALFRNAIIFKCFLGGPGLPKSTPNRRENGPGLHRGLEKVIFGRFQKKHEKKKKKRTASNSE